MPKKGKIKNLITSSDIYGETINLKIKNNTTSQTMIGGVLTIITIGLIMGAAWSTGKDIIYKQKPSINIEDKLFPQRPDLLLDTYNFPFAIVMQDYSNNAYILPKYFTYELLHYSIFNSNATTFETRWDLEQCNYTHFPRLTTEFFDKAGIKNYMCIKKQNITIGGYWDEDNIKYIIVRIKLCQNSTKSEIICASPEEISEFVATKPFTWNIYAQNSIINTQNYTDPISYFLLNLYKNIRVDVAKMYNVFLRRQEVETDVGIMLEDLITKFSISFDSADYDDMTVSPDSLMDINLFASNHIPIYHRKYLKFQELLANLGGLAKALMMGSYILSFYFSRIKMNQKILNKIFEYELKDIESKPLKRNNLITKKQPLKNSDVIIMSPILLRDKGYTEQSQSQMLNILPQSKIIGNPSRFADNIRNEDGSESQKKRLFKYYGRTTKSGESEIKRISLLFTQQMNRILNDRKLKYKLKFSYVEMLNLILCPCSLIKKMKPKNKLYKKSRKELDHYLDVSVIIQKLDEFEKFKMILLSPEQIAMFSFISKNLCSLKNKEKIKSDMNEMKDFIKDKEKLLSMIFDYKERIKSSPNDLTSIDMKLFKLLNEEIKKEFSE
jgi:hypothetical protein